MDTPAIVGWKAGLRNVASPELSVEVRSRELQGLQYLPGFWPPGASKHLVPEVGVIMRSKETKQV